MIPSICPCCGTDIRLDDPITIDDFAMFGDGYPLTYLRKPLKLAPRESSVCWALMKAYPLVLSTDVLLNRIGSEDAEGNVVQVYVHRIRAKLKMLGIEDPIETVYGRGFRWRSAGEIRDAVAEKEV